MEENFNLNIHPDVNSNISKEVNQETGKNVNKDVDKNTYSDINQGINTAMSLDINPDINNVKSQEIDPEINTAMTSDVNPDINTIKSPDINSSINTDMNSGINTDMNSDVNSGMNLSHKTEITPAITPANIKNEIEKAIHMKEIFNRLFNTVLQQGVDFDRIPGSDKPTLLKPGADLLCQIFHFASGEPKILSFLEDFEKGILSYTVSIPIIHKDTGTVAGVGIGSANSMR